MKAADERVAAAEAQLREALRPLAVATQAPANLDTIEQELAAAQTALATWNEAQAAIQRAEEDVARRRRAHEAPCDHRSRRSRDEPQRCARGETGLFCVASIRPPYRTACLISWGHGSGRRRHG